MVVNPMSAGGALGRRWMELAGTIRRHLPFEEVRTRRPGDATRLAREALVSGADRVVAIGGDGTINEVVNGFFDGDQLVRPGAALGVLPFGTGGDFRKTIHMPRDVDAAARILARGTLRRIDVGLLELTGHDGGAVTRIFANIASFGISGLVDQLVNTSSKALGGRLSFLVATARAGLKYKNQRVRMVFDGDQAGARDVTIQTVAVANGRYFGGGMYIAPKAELDDGQFDVVVLGDFDIKDMLVHGRHLYSGTHLKLDKVSFRRARTLQALPLDGEDVELDVDGENPGTLPATFRILPAALDLVVPG